MAWVASDNHVGTYGNQESVAGEALADARVTLSLVNKNCFPCFGNKNGAFGILLCVSGLFGCAVKVYYLQI